MTDMKIPHKENAFAHTFFSFGMSEYIISFISVMHYYRISKEIFRDDFGPFKWYFKGNDFLGVISRDKADFAFSKPLHYFLIFALSVSVAFLFLPLFLIKNFGIITSFVIYAGFTFFQKKA